jgi:hypothetical protein
MPTDAGFPEAEAVGISISSAAPARAADAGRCKRARTTPPPPRDEKRSGVSPQGSDPRSRRKLDASRERDRGHPRKLKPSVGTPLTARRLARSQIDVLQRRAVRCGKRVTEIAKRNPYFSSRWGFVGSIVIQSLLVWGLRRGSTLAWGLGFLMALLSVAIVFLGGFVDGAVTIAFVFVLLLQVVVLTAPPITRFTWLRGQRSAAAG